MEVLSISQLALGMMDWLDPPLRRMLSIPDNLRRVLTVLGKKNLVFQSVKSCKGTAVF